MHHGAYLKHMIIKFSLEIVRFLKKKKILHLSILVDASLGDELPNRPWLYRQFHGMTDYYFFPELSYGYI